MLHLQMKLYFVKHRDEKSFIVHEIEKRTAVTGQQFKRFVYVTPHYGEHLAGFLVHGPCFENSKLVRRSWSHDVGREISA